MTAIEACTPAARFRVSWPSDVDEELREVREALATFPPGDGRAPDVSFSIELNLGDGREQYTLRESGGGVRHCVDVNQVVSALVGRLNSRHLEEASDLVNVHAAGLASGERGVILTGPSGSGKSTLTLAAVAAGFEYLTDETVGIDPDGRMRWYPKPITVKGDAWSFVAPLVGATPPEVERASARRWEIPATSLRAGAVRAEAEPALVLSVAHDPDGHARHRSLDAVAVLGSLVANSSDLDRFGPAGLQRLARVAAQAIGAELTYRDATAAVQVIASLLGGPRPALDVEELDAPSDGGALAPAGLTAATRPARRAPSVVIDGRAVVHRPEFDRLFALDPLATHAWRLLDGRRSVEEIETVVSDGTGLRRGDVEELIEDLARLGLLGALRSVEPPG